MKVSSKELLQAPLTAHEMRWASELADTLPDDIDLTFEESKIMARLSLREWPEALLLKVKDAIDVEDFLVDGPEEPALPADSSYTVHIPLEGMAVL